MKRSLLFIIIAFLFTPLFAQYNQYKVSGGSGQPLSATKSGNTEVYLLNGLEGAQIEFTSSQSGDHQWYQYKNSIDDAVLILSTQNGNTSTITNISDSCGYYVVVSTSSGSLMGPGYIWIVDYSKCVPQFSDLRVVEDEYKCEQLKLDVKATVPDVYFYTNGIPNPLKRIFLLTYNNLRWEDDQKTFTPIDTTVVLNGILPLNGMLPEILVDHPPLVNTTFTLTDSFAAHFGIQQYIRTEEYQAIAVNAQHSEAETTKIHADNEVHHAGDVWGGSAPVDYTFTAYANEPVAALYIWKITRQDATTNETIVRYTDKVLQYTFDRNGIYHVGLEVSDAQSVCVDSAGFNITIDSTSMKIPNAFSPGSSIGVNDELKVAFTSVITFKASVYNRWGNLLFQWTDPTKGWDGRVSGKFVPTGVYYVIVEYKDSNGKNRTASQAVNLLRAKDQLTPSTP